jgi:phosphorylcholine metabolism protein LicD
MINQENAISNLKELDLIFRKHNIRYWIQDGTLLGCVRDNKFIPHDNDIDIGCRWSDFTQNLFFEIVNNGFEFKTSHGRLDQSLIINFRKRGIPVDIYFYYKDGERFYHCAAYGKARKFRVDFSYKEFDVKEITFLNTKLFAPEDELYFIETKYGKDWKDPKPEWDSNENPLNRTFTDIQTTKSQSREAFNAWRNNDRV